ncbi:F-BAR domain only protein 2 isoform X3 [Tachysurus ichikawai]
MGDIADVVQGLSDSSVNVVEWVVLVVVFFGIAQQSDGLKEEAILQSTGVGSDAIGERNNGFDILYHNMKHGQISSKELADFIRESGSLSTKEEVAPTLEAVQNIQSVSQALQKSKENYNSKILEQERMRKEGSTQRDLDKAGLKVKKAREIYKSYVEKYASTKTEFEQKMEDTAQKFQDIEESHIVQMKEIIRSYSHLIEDTHTQIGEVQKEFVINMENTSVESLLHKLAENKGTGRERPGPIDFEECTVSLTTEGAKPRKRKTFAIPGRRKDKDTDSTESTEVETTNTANGAPSDTYGPIDFQNANVPQVDEEGFCIRPEFNENDILYPWLAAT